MKESKIRRLAVHFFLKNKNSRKLRMVRKEVFQIKILNNQGGHLPVLKLARPHQPVETTQCLLQIQIFR